MRSRNKISSPSPVLSKRDFVNRYEQGEFGNRSPTWNTLEDFLSAKYIEGLVHVRNRTAGGDTYYDQTPQQAAELWKKLPSSQYYISAMAPTEKTLFQGEVIQGVKGLDLLFSTIVKPMRPALAESSERVQGVVASMLLTYYLNFNSRDWLNELFDRYPQHAIEFSTYSVCWGTLSGFNTLFWEVRRY